MFHMHIYMCVCLKIRCSQVHWFIIFFHQNCDKWGIPQLSDHLCLGFAELHCVASFGQFPSGHPFRMPLCSRAVRLGASDDAMPGGNRFSGIKAFLRLAIAIAMLEFGVYSCIVNWSLSNIEHHNDVSIMFRRASQVKLSISGL